MDQNSPRYHSSHWGAFSATREGDDLVIHPFEKDPDPSPILQNIGAALNHPARLSRPLIRRGWLTDGPGPDDRRGSDAYIEMDWDEALDIAAPARMTGAAATRISKWTGTKPSTSPPRPG